MKTALECDSDFVKMYFCHVFILILEPRLLKVEKATIF